VLKLYKSLETETFKYFRDLSIIWSGAYAKSAININHFLNLGEQKVFARFVIKDIFGNPN